MKKWLSEILICPECLPHHIPLTLQARETLGDDIVEGQLCCSQCNTRYPIQGGVAEVLPAATRTALALDGGYNSKGMLSAYLWSHYGDMFADPDATGAYSQWSRFFTATHGFALDIGCAVGRLSFEMTTGHHKVVGIDTSRSFIEKARRISEQKRLTFEMIVEGRITEQRGCELDSHWHHERVEFIVADAMALPFADRLFTTVSSINILEKVPDPIRHLTEVNRMLAEQDALFAFSDPFSWDESVSSPDLWIGGSQEGPYAGRGIDVLRRLFTGEGGLINPPLQITQSGSVSWKIRKTENLWEHITSQFLVGRR